MALLVEIPIVRFDKITRKPRLICTPQEYKTIKSQYEQLLLAMANGLELFEMLGQYDKAYEVYDQPESVDIHLDEDANGDDMSKAMPGVL